MKTAVITSSNFSIVGGIERSAIDIARAFNAPIFCTGYDESVTGIFDPEHSVKFVTVGKLPGEPWKNIVGGLMFRRLNIDCDVAICLDDISARYITTGVNHIYYMTTPRRALYDMYYQFVSVKPRIERLVYPPVLALARVIDRRFMMKYIRNIVAISHTTRVRISKVYGKEAVVVYPPVHTDEYYWNEPEGFWLSVGRIDKWKRVGLQVEAFRRMPRKKLVIVGMIHPGFEYIICNAPKNVRWIGNVSDKRLKELYSRCEGVITTAVDEDYGLTAVEAMASGKPVVAVNEGGYRETVVDGVCGKLVSPDIDEIVNGVQQVGERSSEYQFACMNRARLFDYTVFRERMRHIVRNVSAGG